jgi:hypothetical protein
MFPPGQKRQGPPAFGSGPPVVFPTARKVIWNEESKATAHTEFITRPDRETEEEAFHGWGLGSPSSSSLSDYEYVEPPAQEQLFTGPLSVQAMRASCRREFLSWWARRKEKQRRKIKPVLLSSPNGPPKDEAIFFDTRGAEKGASILRYAQPQSLTGTGRL